MPKKLTYEQKHLRNLLRLEKRIDKLFQEAAARVAHLSESVEGFSADDVFTFDKYPYLRNRANKLVAELNNAVETTIFDGVRLEWDLANEKNDSLARSVLGSAVEHLDGTTRRRYFATNAGACEAFLARRERGLNLSERVWNLSKQFKEEMEMGLDLGLRDGISAVEMSRTLRRYLQNPTALFRRVRDEHGILHLSQRAAAYHPGRGVYRSAYKNARRLTATEVNIAYRTADHLRMQDLDFVVGVEIQLSENHTCLGADGKPHRFHDICDDLKGKYPKTFKFTGWHPHCRCYATPILKTEEEFDADTQRILQGEEPTEGSENAVDELPDEFKAWAKENEPRLEAAKARGTLPYFVRDNDALIDGAFAPKKKTLLEIAEERHAKRTKEEEDAIRQRWAARAKAKEEDGDGRFSSVIESLKKRGVDYNDVKPLKQQLEVDEIIERLAGGDETKGSCSSLALAFAGNRAGFDVLDFRGGASCEFFSKVPNIRNIIKAVDGIEVRNTNDYKAANELLLKMTEGKEYYFTCGRHAAILRKKDGVYEYLELQSSDPRDNGFKRLTIHGLKTRFKAQKSHTSYKTKYDVSSFLVDVESLGKSPGYRKLVGYINTAKDKQKKGLYGGLK